MKFILFFACTTLFFSSSCNQINQKIDDELNKIQSKADSIDSLVNKKVDQVKQIDSMIQNGTNQVKKIDTLVQKSQNQLDSLKRKGTQMIEKVKSAPSKP